MDIAKFINVIGRYSNLDLSNKQKNFDFMWKFILNYPIRLVGEVDGVSTFLYEWFDAAGSSHCYIECDKHRKIFDFYY